MTNFVTQLQYIATHLIYETVTWLVNNKQRKKIMKKTSIGFFYKTKKKLKELKF